MVKNSKVILSKKGSHGNVLSGDSVKSDMKNYHDRNKYELSKQREGSQGNQENSLGIITG